jgi:hypothetical protein
MSFGKEPTGQVEPTEERSARRRSERKRRKGRARAAEATAIDRGPSRTNAPRLPALVALVAAIVGLATVERATEGEREGAAAELRADDPGVRGTGGTAAPSPRPPVDAVAPVAAPAGALGATWFCAAGTATDDGAADHTVVVANPGPTTVTVTVTAFPGAIDGDAAGLAVTAGLEPAADTLELGPDEVISVRVAEILDAPFAGALVELSGGTGVVEHTISGEFGVAAAPCATSPSSTWYLAAGDTTRGARDLVVLFNPFPDDAVADLTFATTEGFRAPQQYANLVVPGQRVLVLDIGAVVTRVPEAAATITTRAGRLVVDRIQSYDGTDGPAGTDLTPAAPRPAPVWTFPAGLVADGVTESVTVYNPSERRAEVDVEFTVDPAVDPAVDLVVEPIELSIAPESYAEVVVNEEQRVPPDVEHSIVMRTQNDVPVVAERWTRSTEPAEQAGLSATLGSPLVATTWYLAAGAAGEGTELLTVVNPSRDTDAVLDVEALAGGQRSTVDGLSGLEVPAGERLVVDVVTALGRPEAALVVTATVPVVVERRLGGADGTGTSRSVGVPAAEGAALRLPEG